MPNKTRAASRLGGLLCIVLAVVVCGPGRRAPADDADDIAAAILRETPNRPEAAKKILEAAKSLTDSPSVQIRLCQKAYEHGMASPAGYPTAIAALGLLERVAPTRIDHWREKRLEVYRLQYYRSTRGTKADNGRSYVKLLLLRAKAAGKSDKWKDASKYYRQAYQVARTLNLPQKKEIYEDSRIAATYEMMHNRIEVLRGALGRNPNDPYSRKQLILTYLVDLDRPSEAVKYLGSKVDATLRKNVTMAAKEAAELGDADFFTLGTWYRSLAGKAALKHAKVNMLRRALDNVNRYLEVYTKQDAQRLRATEMVAAIEAELKKLGDESARRPALPPGAVLFLTFEKKALVSRLGRTIVRDESGAKHDGVVIGPAFAPRAGGRAMVFDGRSYIDMGNPPGLQVTGDMTICMWINPASLSSRQNPMSKAYGGEGTWTLETNGTINYYCGSSGRNAGPYTAYRTSTQLKVGQWTHMALVRDMSAKTVTWYANGKAVFAGPARHAVKASAYSLLIGKGYVRNFRGMLDNVGVFKRALTADEIHHLATPPLD